MAQFLQYKAGDRRVAKVKYRKTEDRLHMTDKNVNWNVKRIHRHIKYTLH